MSFLLSMSLPFLVSCGLVAVTSILWWKEFAAPWLFAVVGLLSLLGLHRAIQIFAEVAKLLVGGGGYFLEARQSKPDFAELAQESITTEAVVVSLLLLIIGLPLLVWLRREMSIVHS